MVSRISEPSTVSPEVNGVKNRCVLGPLKGLGSYLSFGGPGFAWSDMGPPKGWYLGCCKNFVNGDQINGLFHLLKIPKRWLRSSMTSETHSIGVPWNHSQFRWARIPRDGKYWDYNPLTFTNFLGHPRTPFTHLFSAIYFGAPWLILYNDRLGAPHFKASHIFLWYLVVS